MVKLPNVGESIAKHAARNKELLKILRDQGVDMSQPRDIEYHFWSSGQCDASLLAKALYERGYLVLFIAPIENDNREDLWSVEARAQRSPTEAASAALTRELVLMAAEFGSIYDGWGTEIGQEDNGA